MWTRNETPWVDKAVATAMGRLVDVAPEGALPYETPSSSRYRPVFTEYGCGVYGCVLPTSKPGTVLKLTTDQSEAGLVALLLSPRVQREVRLEGIVKYEQIVKLSGMQHKRRPLYAIWREEAFEVGSAAGLGRWVWGHGCTAPWGLVTRFKEWAGFVRNYINPGKSGAQGRIEKVRNLADWASRVAQYGDSVRPGGKHIGDQWKNPHLSAIALQQCEWTAQEMGSTPEVYLIGEALEDLLAIGVLLADVHLGNVGKVEREDYSGPIWVITDPGHAVILDPELELPPILEV